ncbi:protein-L-isoaspartate O-methyltransferase [Pleomorphomonas sp. JP5]|uniref:protein-L-isoaspartate O-methyltransferase family protein n=1 Tax=Pleomorphomonas sp. JP5 TaxID=2942998 RepID=UPI002044B8E2|nr:protein-L-isoaspartate O-methyltransferase [Pleomorphomonas sp. JP5]MCM5558749.1 protein-L-isoaspartate O-methyltransferase [Pleomorphomonas sp. JP5]
MVDFPALRTKMVDGQVRPNDVTDLRIIDAMGEVERENFAPGDQRPLAYLDRDLPLGGGRASRVLIQPMVLARMLQYAAIKPTDKVLEVGSASGYGAAVMARLAGSVVALEQDSDLATIARRQLAGLANVAVVEASLVKGAPDAAPFDVIIFNGAVAAFPDAIAHQLAKGGRLLLVEEGRGVPRAKLYARDDGGISGRALFDASVPVLPGFEAVETFAF